MPTTVLLVLLVFLFVACTHRLNGQAWVHIDLRFVWQTTLVVKVVPAATPYFRADGVDAPFARYVTCSAPEQADTLFVTTYSPSKPTAYITSV